MSTTLTVGGVTITIAEHTIKPEPTPPGAFHAGTYHEWTKEQVISRLQEREAAVVKSQNDHAELLKALNVGTQASALAAIERVRSILREADLPSKRRSRAMNARTELERSVLRLLRARCREARTGAVGARVVVEVYCPRAGKREVRSRTWWDVEVRGWEADSPDFLSDLKPGSRR
jgi:hypothetical protein